MTGAGAVLRLVGAMKHTLALLTGLLLLVATTLTVHAAIVDLGDGLIYDTVQDITWLQDMNYADTTGHDDILYAVDTDGTMFWADAVAWADNLIFAGGTDWRLPVSPDLFDGFGGTASEMGHLYWADGVTSATPSPFFNVRPGGYWSGSVGGGNPFFFAFSDGQQGPDLNDHPVRLYATAVHTGLVPESSRALLTLLGLGAVLVKRRR